MANFCRREVQKEGEALRFCNKAIARVNPLDWCQDCRKRLPIWPTEETPTPAPVVETAPAVSAEDFQEVS